MHASPQVVAEEWLFTPLPQAFQRNFGCQLPPRPHLETSSISSIIYTLTNTPLIWLLHKMRQPKDHLIYHSLPTCARRKAADLPPLFVASLAAGR